MTEGTTKKFMFVNRKAPYGTRLRAGVAGGRADHGRVRPGRLAVFIDDGVFQLKKGQQTKGIETKNFSPTYRALEGYDVEKLYVEQESLEARGLTEDDLIVDVTVLAVARARRADGRAGRGPEFLRRARDAAHRQQVAAGAHRRSTPACASPRGGAMLLIEDAVYAAVRGTAAEAQRQGGAGPASRSSAAARPRGARHRRPRDRRRRPPSTTAASSTSSPNTTHCQSWL